ncbi:bromodomain-containing protein 8-like [Sagmatias obliquidens]|uniref:bromodomain-containing protein 8-like n=1 Tax=Sagmatias obliquidens TaxID=3371155 RepID=UPI000F446132|nr:bromodomain-containing protein 8-like [Lagenorhynchus obliquidens]
MLSRKKFLTPYLSTKIGRWKCLRNTDLSEFNAFFSVYLQMRHEWVWLDSEQDYPNDSELSNDCRSLFSSWDSSLDLDLGSWRETEEPGAEELEESSPGREPRELLVGDGGSEESQEEAEQVSRQNLLHFISEVVYLMEPLCISKKESGEGCSPSSGIRQQEARGIEATEGEGKPCKEPEELSAKVDPLVTEKSLLGENGRPEVAPPPSDIWALQEQPTASAEGEVQQESKEQDQSEGYVSEMEDQRSSGECDDSFSIQETPLVDILFSHATSSKLSDLGHSDPVQDHLLFKKTLLPVWKMIASHRFSSLFLKPVSERQAPGYKDVVKRPMDLTSLKRNLSKGRIRTVAQFQRDLMLMFQNAVMYNDSDHQVYRMAVEMQREVLEQIQVLSIWLDERRVLNSLE